MEPTIGKFEFREHTGATAREVDDRTLELGRRAMPQTGLEHRQRDAWHAVPGPAREKVDRFDHRLRVADLRQFAAEVAKTTVLDIEYVRGDRPNQAQRRSYPAEALPRPVDVGSRRPVPGFQKLQCSTILLEQYPSDRGVGRLIAMKSKSQAA